MFHLVILNSLEIQAFISSLIRQKVDKVSASFPLNEAGSSKL